MSKKSAHMNSILWSTPYSRALCCAMARRSADISTAITCKGREAGQQAGQHVVDTTAVHCAAPWPGAPQISPQQSPAQQPACQPEEGGRHSRHVSIAAATRSLHCAMARRSANISTSITCTGSGGAAGRTLATRCIPTSTTSLESPESVPGCIILQTGWRCRCTCCPTLRYYWLPPPDFSAPRTPKAHLWFSGSVGQGNLPTAAKVVQLGWEFSLVIYPGSTPVGNATLVVANVLTCNQYSQKNLAGT
jgi:hypothetical protein